MARGKTPERVARELLLSYLSVWQRSSFRLFKRIYVRGSYTGRKYAVITSGLPYGNIRCGKDKYCFVLDKWHPRSDHFLAQVITLTVDEREFLHVAVRYKNYYLTGRTMNKWP